MTLIAAWKLPPNAEDYDDRGIRIIADGIHVGRGRQAEDIELSPDEGSAIGSIVDLVGSEADRFNTARQQRAGSAQHDPGCAAALSGW